MMPQAVHKNCSLRMLQEEVSPNTYLRYKDDISCLIQVQPQLEQTYS